MRKATAIVGYHGTDIYALSVITRKGDSTQLIKRNEHGATPYEYKDFNSMYAFIIKYLKSNGFELTYYSVSGLRWYEIVWYDVRNPSVHQTFGIPYHLIGRKEG